MYAQVSGLVLWKVKHTLFGKALSAKTGGSCGSVYFNRLKVRPHTLPLWIACTGATAVDWAGGQVFDDSQPSVCVIALVPT